MRFQLALNVSDLEKAVAYYTQLFGVAPRKRKPGYANFAVESPPLKLVLFEQPGAPERLNHVGFEYFDNEEVEAVARDLEPKGLVDSIDRDESCCYAKKSTVWTHDPQGLRCLGHRPDNRCRIRGSRHHGQRAFVGFGTEREIDRRGFAIEAARAM